MKLAALAPKGRWTIRRQTANDRRPGASNARCAGALTRHIGSHPLRQRGRTSPECAPFEWFSRAPWLGSAKCHAISDDPRHFLKEIPVVIGECRGRVAVDVDFADNLAIDENGNHNLRSRLD